MPQRDTGQWNGRRLRVAVLVGYGALLWLLFGASPIGGSWREADTQAIARNLLASGFDILHPRVDWRGAGDGAVECEFPLYQAAIAAVLAVCGDVEWPGRLLSVLSVLVATAALFALLRLRCGALAAAIGALVFLTSSQAALLGSRVMPDALSTALTLSGLVLFARTRQNGRHWQAGAAVALIAAGVLAKPTALQFVVVAFAAAFCCARPALRRWQPWLGAAVVVALLAAWTWHARRLGLASGLTFGVTFGDTKLPAPDHLVRPGLYAGVLRTSLEWGISWFGLLAMAWLVARRRLDRLDAAVVTITAAGLVGTMRYSASADMGPHYHVVASIAGAYLVARAWPPRAGRLAIGLALAALVAQATVALSREHRARREFATHPHLAAAAALREVSAPDDLVVVRGAKPAFDPFWRRPNNFEEPVLLYQARRRGTVLPADGTTEERLAAAAAAGARWYVTSISAVPADPPWLDAHGREVFCGGGVRIVRLQP